LLYIAVEIDELADGHYDFTIKFDGQIDNATIMNKYGDDAVSPTGETILSFDINGGSNLPAALIAYADKPVNVTYPGTGRLSNVSTPSATSSATSSPVATATSKSGAEKMAMAPGTMLLLLSMMSIQL
jgi:hypothetical protein